jgi:hypothetical protein
MSGDNRMVIVNVTAIHGAGWPNGLAVDYETNRIYWIDARLACRCFVMSLRTCVNFAVSYLLLTLFSSAALVDFYFHFRDSSGLY